MKMPLLVTRTFHSNKEIDSLLHKTHKFIIAEPVSKIKEEMSRVEYF